MRDTPTGSGPGAVMGMLAASLESVGARITGGTSADIAHELSAVLDGANVSAWTAAGTIPVGWLPEGRLARDEYVELAHDPGAAKLACIELADLAIAETGSVLTSGAADDRRLAMLADVHILLVDRSRVVESLRDASAWINAQVPSPPYFSFITGASRTSDIERTLTIGVHGPSALHVIVVDP